MMIGEGSVDLVKKDDMLTGQLLCKPAHCRACSPISGIPGDFQVPRAVEILCKTLDVGLSDVVVLRICLTSFKVAAGSQFTERLNILAEDSLFADYNLETIIFRRVM